MATSRMTAQECEKSQRNTYAQSPAAQVFSELFNVELMRLHFQLMGVTYCGVDTSARCDDSACGPLNDFKGIVANRLDNKEWRRWRRYYAGLLVEVRPGLRADVAAGNRRLRIVGRCSADSSNLPNTTYAAHLDDDGTVELTGAAGRAFFDIRASIIKDRAALKGLQLYVEGLE